MSVAYSSLIWDHSQVSGKLRLTIATAKLFVGTFDVSEVSVWPSKLNDFWFGSSFDCSSSTSLTETQLNQVGLHLNHQGYMRKKLRRNQLTLNQ